MKKLKKTANLESKVGKYFLARKEGKTKKEAQIVAGYSTPTHSTAIERSNEFKALQTRFGNDLEQQITIQEINAALVDNIKQSGQKRIDRNARNKAIEIARDIIEPKDGSSFDIDAENVQIVLMKPTQ